MRYLVIMQQQYSENTPEYGMGDYPDQIDYIACVVAGDTLRKAQNAVKKIYPRVRFGGMFSPEMFEATPANIKRFAKPADKRLGPNATARHNAALWDLNERTSV